jgi:hypothetical protein
LHCLNGILCVTVILGLEWFKLGIATGKMLFIMNELPKSPQYWRQYQPHIQDVYHSPYKPQTRAYTNKGPQAWQFPHHWPQAKSTQSSVTIPSS